MEREESINLFDVSNENNKNNFNEPLQLVITLLSKNNYKIFDILPLKCYSRCLTDNKNIKNIYNMTVSLPNPRF